MLCDDPTAAYPPAHADGVAGSYDLELRPTILDHPPEAPLAGRLGSVVERATEHLAGRLLRGVPEERR